jgi:hypothetical protein
VLGFKLPFYKSATLLLSLGLSIRVLYYLFKQRPQVIHVSTPGIMCFAAGEAQERYMCVCVWGGGGGRMGGGCLWQAGHHYKPAYSCMLGMLSSVLHAHRCVCVLGGGGGSRIALNSEPRF